MTEPSYTSYSVIFSFLLVLTSIAHAYSMDATDMMAARGSGSAYTTSTTNSNTAIENEEEIQVPVNQEVQDIDNNSANKETEAPEVIDTRVSNTPPVAAQDIKDTWFINIASLRIKDEADRIVERVRRKGIDAAQKHVLVNGKKYWRVSVRGFPSSDEAKSHAILVKDILGIKEVWVGKETGEAYSTL
jgi:cell division septation protein DedD